MHPEGPNIGFYAHKTRTEIESKIVDIDALTHCSARTGRLKFWAMKNLVSATASLLSFSELLTFNINWLVLSATGLASAMANLVGYWKCSKDAKKRMHEWASSQAMRAVVGNAM